MGTESTDPDPSKVAHRAKANRLRARARNGKLGPIETLWLAEYDERIDSARKEKRNFGASKSQRRVRFEMDEAAQSVGEGSAAVQAAGAALAVRAEGKRLDNLTIASIDALRESKEVLMSAVQVYKEVCISLRERQEVLEATHVTLLESVDAHFLARTEAELSIRRLQADAENQGLNADSLLGELIRGHMPNANGKGPAAPPKKGS